MEFETIEDFRKWLGPVGLEYTVPELRKLHMEMQVWVELLLDIYEYRIEMEQKGKKVW